MLAPLRDRRRVPRGAAAMDTANELDHFASCPKVRTLGGVHPAVHLVEYGRPLPVGVELRLRSCLSDHCGLLRTMAALMCSAISAARSHGRTRARRVSPPCTSIVSSPRFASPAPRGVPVSTELIAERRNSVGDSFEEPV